MLHRDAQILVHRIEIVIARMRICELVTIHSERFEVIDLAREAAEELRKFAYLVPRNITQDAYNRSEGSAPAILVDTARKLLPVYRDFISHYPDYVEHQVVMVMSRFFHDDLGVS
jgi:hypothetical protein